MLGFLGALCIQAPFIIFHFVLKECLSIKASYQNLFILAGKGIYTFSLFIDNSTIGREG